MGRTATGAKPRARLAADINADLKNKLVILAERRGQTMVGMIEEWINEEWMYELPFMRKEHDENKI